MKKLGVLLWKSLILNKVEILWMIQESSGNHIQVRTQWKPGLE